MPLKPSAYLILGMLRAGVDTGYAIKRTVDLSTRFFWAASFAQVYPELARLEEDGYVVGQADAQGRRLRKRYRVTKKGERALNNWLRDTRLPGFEFRDEGLLRLFFADALPNEDAVALVTRLRSQADGVLRSFRDAVVLTADGASPRFRFPALAARLGVDYYAWRANWFAQLEVELKASHKSSNNRRTRH